MIHGLLQYPWLTIYPVNPVTSARYRTAFTPSGDKDDLPDAHVLLEMVRDQADKRGDGFRAGSRTRPSVGVALARAAGSITGIPLTPARGRGGNQNGFRRPSRSLSPS